MCRHGGGLPGRPGLRRGGWRFVLASRRGCGMRVDCAHRFPAVSAALTGYRGPRHFPTPF
ncbi:hypothetical protein C2I33_13485 [Ralstonia solanacearum]|nr:hypothetical protein C2I33_13485 [Ralstonia solanacearum]